MHEAVVVIRVNNSNGWHQQLIKRGVLIPHVLWRKQQTKLTSKHKEDEGKGSKMTTIF